MRSQGRKFILRQRPTVTQLRKRKLSQKDSKESEPETLTPGHHAKEGIIRPTLGMFLLQRTVIPIKAYRSSNQAISPQISSTRVDKSLYESQQKYKMIFLFPQRSQIMELPNPEYQTVMCSSIKEIKDLKMNMQQEITKNRVI